MIRASVDERLRQRAGLKTAWLSPDVAENYRPVHKDYGRNRFSPTEITYSFNSAGYRCAEFGASEEPLPIVFLGCSITEGCGLHLEQTWSYLLLEKVRNFCDISAPYWSLALTSSGIDTQVSNLYWFGKRYTRPKLVIGLLPPMIRREISFEGEKRQLWVASNFEFPGFMNKLLLDEDFAEHQTERSYMLLVSLLNSWGATGVIGSWDYHNSSAHDRLIAEKFPELVNVKIGDWKKINKSWARDGCHWGLEMHEHIAECYWEKVKPLLSARSDSEIGRTGQD